MGVFFTIIIEVGLMIFPLPGDTLLFATGILAQSNTLNYFNLLLVCIVASTISGHIGYFIGTKVDRDILLNNRIYKIKDHHLHKTEKFFEKYGIYAIIFSRFIPVVRSFISPVLGMIRYDKHKYFWANLLASIIWPLVVVTLGYALGSMFPDLIVYAEYLMIFILIVLIFPLLHELWKNKSH